MTWYLNQVRSWVVLLVMFFAVMAWIPVARSVELYVPPDYDPYGVPQGPCQFVDCYPKLWYWPAAPIHTLNLTGVKYAFWSPPMPNLSYPTWFPKSHVSVFVNYWGKTAGAPAVGDTMVVSGYVSTFRTFMSGVTADSVSKITGGFATITSMPADSVYEGMARLYLTNPTWAKPESLTTYFRLVEEHYRR